MYANKLINTIKKYAVDNSGFGLLELVIALSLLGIILTMGFMFFFFGAASFNVGEQQADIQQNARLAADFVTRELRIAERIVIVDSHEDLEALAVDVDSEEYLVYYIYEQDGSIFYQEAGDIVGLPEILEAISGNINFDLKLMKSATEDNIIKMQLLAENIESERSYVLDTEVLVLNLDEIEDNSDGQGKAVFYQVPAPPDPAFRNILIDPQGHEWSVNDDDQKIEITVETINVPDKSTVKAEFYSLDSGSEGPIDTVEGEINDNYHIFEKDNGLDNSVSVSKSLDYGYYYVMVSVEGDIDGDDFSITQRRFYFIEPLIEFTELISRPGNPHVGTVILKTGGIPDVIKVIKGTDLIDEENHEEMVIWLVDGEEEGYKTIGFDFHQDPKWYSGEDDYVGYEMLEFGIKVDEPEDARESLFLKVKLPNYDPEFMNISGDIEFESLSNLELSLNDVPIDLDPEFKSETYVYKAEVADDNVYVKAELKHDDGATLEINGQTPSSGDPVNIGLGDVDSSTDIVIKIISDEDDDFIINTYTITVTRTD